MIKKLKLKMTLLVIGVLVAVSVGIVLAINEVNQRNIVTQVESALDALDVSDGVRPTKPASKPSSKPDEKETNTNKPPENNGAGLGGSGNSGNPGGPADPGARRDTRRSSSSLSGEEVASLSNYYTITLDEDGIVKSWASDREDLYDDEYMQWFADEALKLGNDSGRIGTQFFRLTQKSSGQFLIVLDARLEISAGEQVLRTTILVAGIACVLLSFGAWLLIRKMVRPVEEAFRKQQQFVWDASHELKTPLAVIKANADVLENESGENEYLGYIKSEVNRADSLVRNLLTLARMDRGTADHEMSQLDMSEAVLSVLLPFESTVYEAGKKLETDIAENVVISGNEAMLQQLTVILLSNALKYSDEGGTIRVRLSKKGRGCELRVENTGEGIGPEDISRIYDRFYRTDASRNSETGGEGLGLAIAESVVRIHQGRISAESKPGQWTVFTVILP